MWPEIEKHEVPENSDAVAVPVERIDMRLPHSKKERMFAALNSTDDDLYLHNGRVIVTGKNKDGEIVELGSVDERALYQKTVNPHQLLDGVRFGA